MDNDSLDFMNVKKLWDEGQESLVISLLVKEINELKQEAKKATKIVEGLSAWSLVIRQMLVLIPVLITILTLFLNYWGK